MSGLGSRPAEPVLAARGLAKRYGRRVLALDAIDLVVPRGSITALVGPNGGGKSTLMKAWVGFERPTHGKVSVAGIDPWGGRGRRAAALQHIGYVPQHSALYRDLSLIDHVALAASLRRGFDSAAARRRLADLGLDAAQRIGNLSGGQKAQVSLALALTAGGQILILDEPLASLDPLARREFLFQLRRAVDEGGLTAILSSHVVSDVEQACDNLIVLSDGHKLLDARVTDALAAHAIHDGAMDAPTPDRVSSFLGPTGEVLTLLRGRAAGTQRRPASLEELVLGYLAASRPSTIERMRTTGTGW